MATPGLGDVPVFGKGGDGTEQSEETLGGLFPVFFLGVFFPGCSEISSKSGKSAGRDALCHFPPVWVLVCLVTVPQRGKQSAPIPRGLGK